MKKLENQHQKGTMSKSGTYCWVGAIPEGIKVWRTKRDAVKGGAINPKRIAFLFQTVWCDFSGTKLITRQGECPTHSFYSPSGVRYIGFRDREALYDGHALREAWQSSFDLAASDSV